jgi:hypothetical protein
MKYEYVILRMRLASPSSVESIQTQLNQYGSLGFNVISTLMVDSPTHGHDIVYTLQLEVPGT